MLYVTCAVPTCTTSTTHYKKTFTSVTQVLPLLDLISNSLELYIYLPEGVVQRHSVWEGDRRNSLLEAYRRHGVWLVTGGTVSGRVTESTVSGRVTGGTVSGRVTGGTVSGRVTGGTVSGR